MATTGPPAGDGDSTKLYACTTCVQRKVKCDKRQPCFSCFRSSLPCKYRATPPSQRRKRKAFTAAEERIPRPAKQVLLLEKLRSHETALRNAGVAFDSFLDDWNGNDTSDDPEDEDKDEDSGLEPPEKNHVHTLPIVNNKVPHPLQTSQRPASPHRNSRGALLPEYGGKRYYDHGFMGVMGQEYRQGPVKSSGNSTGICRFQPAEAAADIMAAAVLTDMPLSVPLQANQQYQPHPPAATRIKYLTIFLDNVHPLTKVVHAPNIQQLLSDSKISVTTTKNALMFAIYASAVASLTDTECQTMFGVGQSGLLEAFQSATRYALLEASFLKVPDLDLLRAHVLLLTSMFNNSDHYPSWILMGSTIRIAQSQGLHRDGASLGLPPFEVEMRRRLWWYIVTLDARLTEIIGAESSLIKNTDTQLPLNVNDADLKPDMTAFPKNRTGATEMTFCLARYQIAAFVQERANSSRQEGQPLPGKGGRPDEKRGLPALESLLEEKYLRFCDPVIPVQFLTTTFIRSNLCKLKQMALHKLGRQTPEEGYAQQQGQPDQHSINLEKKRQRTFSLAARNVQYDNFIHANKSLHGYLWFVDFHIPWGGTIYILKSLAHRPDWDESMQAAWRQIEEFYEHHPEYLESEKILHSIINGLALQAWAAREVALTAKGLSFQPPPLIIALQARNVHRSMSMHVLKSQGQDPMNQSGMHHLSDMGGLDAIASSEFDLVDSFLAAGDWANWSPQ